MRDLPASTLVQLLVFIALPACASSQNGGSQVAVGGAQSNAGTGSLGGTDSAHTTSGGNSSQSGAAGASVTQTSAMLTPTSGGATTLVSAAATGGTRASGGANSTTQVAGGTKNAALSATGGAIAIGGTATQADTTSSGGKNSSGGTKNTGGANGVGGTKGSGGTSATGTVNNTSATAVCATSTEDKSATIACPQGQIIDSIVFASYGTPSGSCGSFEKGTCNATSSTATVESLCVGRSRCSVPASNSAFGDPCQSTTKHLSVEATCVEGTPIVSPDTPYKGVANSPASQLAALGATWCYNWGTSPKATDCADPYFIPMIWDGSNVAAAIKSIGNAGYTTVLGFNEPNKADQANMSVADAIALWPTLTSNPAIRVGSPAVSDDGRAWLQDFMTQVKSKGLRVDFIAMHWYGWNAGSCTASQLEGAVNWASQWGLPVWVTEFGCMGSSNPDAQTVLDFFADAIPMLSKHPLVERYAWYPWNTYNELYKNNIMTDLGTAFASAPPHLQ